jgi:hypothetical protein
VWHVQGVSNMKVQVERWRKAQRLTLGAGPERSAPAAARWSKRQVDDRRPACLRIGDSYEKHQQDGAKQAGINDGFDYKVNGKIPRFGDWRGCDSVSRPPQRTL